MACVIKSMGLVGMNAYMVDVELDFLKAIPSFDVIGLPDTAIKESRDRIVFAFKNAGYEFPVAKVRVNLAPADIKKTGPIYDVPMFIGLLFCTEQLQCSLEDLSNFAFLGEISFDGRIKGINGVLPMVIHAKENGVKGVFVPSENAYEASVVEGINVYGVNHISEIIYHLCNIKEMSPTVFERQDDAFSDFNLDFADVKGQVLAKRALEIAAAGSHNAILIGTPGSGKSMLAKRLPSILPEMTFDESIEATKLHSIAGMLTKENPLIRIRPFRSPHHTISPAGLSGGGSIPKPGEISLAHNGVLFLDELPEFSRASMEVLRQPIEDGKITISRVNSTLTYPCDIVLIAAMNPCPCGYFGHPTRKCTCTPKQVSAYLSKVSGPMLDRLDLHIDVMPVDFQSMTSTKKEESSEQIRERVNKARQIQNKRFEGTSINSNSGITPAKLNEFCPMDDRAKNMLKISFEQLGLSARAYDRIVKVARTIADLDNAEIIQSCHIAEAIQYRSLDRKYWDK